MNDARDTDETVWMADAWIGDEDDLDALHAVAQVGPYRIDAYTDRFVIAGAGRRIEGQAAGLEDAQFAAVHALVDLIGNLSVDTIEGYDVDELERELAILERGTP